MDYYGGPYDQNPYGRDASGREGDLYPRSDNPYEQTSPYGQVSYGQSSSYAQSSYGASDYSRVAYGSSGADYDAADQQQFDDDPGAREHDHEEISYFSGNTGRIHLDPSSLNSDGTGRIRVRENEGRPSGYASNGNPDSTSRVRYDGGEDAGITGRIRYDRDSTGRLNLDPTAAQTGRIPFGSDATGRYSYSPDNPYSAGRDGTGRVSSSTQRTARTSVYNDRADTTHRTTERIPRADDAMPEGYSDYEDRPRPKKKKKKRSKFVRFFRGLGKYLAQLPTQTLVIFGGSVAAVLVGVILLVVLLPKGEKTVDPANGQLSIADITPTPSLAPTFTPGPTEIPTPTPDPDPLNGTAIKTIGDTNDAIPAVQQRLVELGYMVQPDGGYTTKYGPATKTAVRLFQIKNYADSKDWDGILGSGTYTLLMSDQAKTYYLARGDGDERTKEITKLVEDVSKLQTRLVELGYLTGKATGVYGEGTATAVRTFQSYNGLTVDGKAGQATLTLIYTSDALDAATGKANPRPTPSVDTSSDAAGTGTTTVAATSNTVATTPEQGTGTPDPTAADSVATATSGIEG